MKNCTVCGYDGITEIHRIKNFPVYMGATTCPPEEYVFQDLVYGQCQRCANLQIMELVPLEVLYQDNHNTEVIGSTWTLHNIQFAKFISWSEPKIVCEIGSPSATIFKELQNETWLSKWYSIEPNPANLDGVDKKFILKQAFVDDEFTFEEYDMEKPNSVVMSHVFEHLYNPREILNVLHENLDNGAKIHISIPNMEYISEHELMPPSGLHFEHTFFVEAMNAVYLFQTNGFEVNKVLNFTDHSIFIEATRTDRDLIVSIPELKKVNLKNIKRFKNVIKVYDEIISTIKEIINLYRHEVYLYGSHFPAQYLIFNGIGTENIKGCLDQSKTKIGKTLYGTDLKVFSPEILRGKDNVIVVCHMGPYTDEIKKTILEINDKVRFI